MTCVWCTEEATQAGRRPIGVVGPDYVGACERHGYLIKAMRYDPADINQIVADEKRAEVLQKRAR